jgi:pimeloyl-ACP methyl ester carboxylesterase
MQTTVSADGTPIAFERSGSGEPLIILGGALSDRRGAAYLVPRIATWCAPVTVDRRGRGDSGGRDAGYEPAREMEDVAAIVEAVADGGTVSLFGHSSGAVLALRSAMAGVPMRLLALYEPPFVLPGTRAALEPDLPERLASLVAAGERDTAVRVFLEEATLMPEPVVDGIEGSPAWPRMLELAHTLPFDSVLVGSGALPTVEELQGVTLPVLVMIGGASPAWIRASGAALADSLPNAQLLELPGQTHQAAPEMLAWHLKAFLTGERPEQPVPLPVEPVS